MAITRTAKGTAQQKTGGTTWTPLSSIAIATGALLIVGEINDMGTGVFPSSVTWNGLNLAQITLGGTGPTQTSIWFLVVATGATGNIVVNYPATATAKAMFATEVAGITNAAVDKSSSRFLAATTSPSTLATAATTANDEFLLGVIGSQGPNGDTAGTWGSDTSTNGQRLGTTGGSATGNVTISEGYAIQSATGTRSASKSGITSRNCDAIVVTFKAGTNAYSLTAAAGSFALSGVAATLKAARKLTASAGSFTETGNAAALKKGYPLVASTGTFAETGNPASLLATRKITASAGSFATTGNAATLRADRKLTAAAGSFTETGNPATLAKGVSLSTSAGSFSVTGNAAGLSATRRLSAGTGSFAETGNAATLKAARKLSASPGAFNVTGNAATLTYTPSGSYSLSAGTGSFAVSGNAAALRRTYNLSASAGAFVETGNAAALASGRKLPAGAGTFLATGQSATLFVSSNGSATLSANSGTFNVSGNDAALLAARRLAAGTGRFHVTRPLSLTGRLTTSIANSGLAAATTPETHNTVTPTNTGLAQTRLVDRGITETQP